MEIEILDVGKNAFVIASLEHRQALAFVAPDAVHHEERDEHSCRDRRIDFPKFAGVDAAADDSTEEPQSAGNDFLGVELREVRELVELADDEAMDRRESRGADKLPVSLHDEGQLFGRAAGGWALFAALDRRNGRLPDHFPKEGFLVCEVKVDGAFGDPRAGVNVFKSGVGEPLLAEDVERGVYDLGGSRLRPALPAWGSGLSDGVSGHSFIYN